MRSFSTDYIFKKLIKSNLHEADYPVVGDILLICKDIGYYKNGDYFFVHSQDEESVSDCALYGPNASPSLNETFITDREFDDRYAVKVENENLIKELWDMHLISLGAETHGR